MTSGAIRDLSKAPLPGDIFDLGQNEYVTVISIRDGHVTYAAGAIELSMTRDVPEEVQRTALAMPLNTFRKWLATIAAGRPMDTPPPG